MLTAHRTPENKMDDLILIDGGDTFEGSWDQLADCFGVLNKNDLIAFCQNMDSEYEIRKPVIH